MELYDDQFLQGLDEDPKIAIYSVCNYFLSQENRNDFGIEQRVEVFALLEVLIRENDLDIDIPDLSGDRSARTHQIDQFVFRLRNNLKTYVDSDEEDKLLRSFRSQFSAQVSNSFVYEFTDGDLARIQSLINELRDLLVESNLFEDGHRRRLMKRLERLQQELHKKQSDLDRFWGLVGDAGVALRKFGADAKPFVDRIKEITDIIWRTQSRAEELPSDTRPPLLDVDE